MNTTRAAKLAAQDTKTVMKVIDLAVKLSALVREARATGLEIEVSTATIRGGEARVRGWRKDGPAQLLSTYRRYTA